MPTTLHLLWPLLPWAFANLVLLGVTGLVWRRLRVGSRAVDVLAFLLLFLFLTTAFLMLCGLAGILRPWPVLGFCALGGLGLGVFAREELRELLATLRRHLGRGWARRGDRSARERLADGIFLALAVFLAVRIAVHVWFLPPYVWDTLSYHLPNVAEWIQAGRLVIFDTPVDRTFWPANYELFQTWLVLFPHHDFLIDLASVPFYALAVGSVYALARRLGLGRRPSRFAALFYAFTPAPLQHATTGNNDLPITAVYLFLAALALDTVRSGGHRHRRRLHHASLALGLAVGTKLYVLFLLPGLAVLLVPLLTSRRRDADADEEAGEETGPGIDRRLVAGLLLLAVLLGGYWYLRNAVVFGNPFYPAEPRMFGLRLFESTAVSGPSPSESGRQGVFLDGEALGENLEALVTTRIFDPEPFNFSLKDMSGWGWLVFVCGWPALLVGLFVSRPLRLLVAAFGVSLLVLLSSVVPDPWNLRFALWFPALPILAFVVMVSRLRVRVLRTALVLVGLACTLLNAAGTLDMGRLPPWMWIRMAHFPVAERSTAALGLFIGRSYFDALETLPPGEPIGYNTHYNGWIYPLYGADLSHPLRYVPIGPGTDVAAALAAREVRYLFVSNPPPAARVGLERAVAGGVLRPIGEGLYAVAE